jgi:Na+-driven multidrug efflux pump
MVVFAGESVALFLPDTPDNAAAIAAGSRFLQLQAMFYTILSVLMVFRNVLQGMGYPFMPFMAGVTEMVLRVLVAIFFPGWFGFDGVCLAHPIAWLGGALPLVIEYFRITKRLKKTGIPTKKTTAGEDGRQVC